MVVPLEPVLLVSVVEVDEAGEVDVADEEDVADVEFEDCPTTKGSSSSAESLKDLIATRRPTCKQFSHSNHLYAHSPVPARPLHLIVEQ